MKNLFNTFSLILLGGIGWAICGVIYYVGEHLFRSYHAILIHFILAPFVFIGLSYLYFKYLNYTRPVITALIITLIVIGLDLVVVAILIEQSFDMFSSVMGTWLPFIFIFLTVFLTGLHFNDKTLGR
jgi:multisubunit Na+/H+ antiporter MnhC subunit